jgi:hypothetical protein
LLDGQAQPDARNRALAPGSCHDLPFTEEQISIGKRDHDPQGILGETERPLFFESQESPHGERPEMR